MYDLTPASREKCIANLTETMAMLHSTQNEVLYENREGRRILAQAWRHMFRQREFYMVHAVCESCWQVIDNRDYEGWHHEDGEVLCGDEGLPATPAVMPWNRGLAA